MIKYHELMAQPIEEIRATYSSAQITFRHELWYGDFQMYMTVGICQPPEKHALQVRNGPQGDGL